jgi:hypothetical protein
MACFAFIKMPQDLTVKWYRTSNQKRNCIYANIGKNELYKYYSQNSETQPNLSLNFLLPKNHSTKNST